MHFSSSITGTENAARIFSLRDRCLQVRPVRIRLEHVRDYPGFAVSYRTTATFYCSPIFTAPHAATYSFDRPYTYHGYSAPSRTV